MLPHQPVLHVSTLPLTSVAHSHAGLYLLHMHVHVHVHVTQRTCFALIVCLLSASPPTEVQQMHSGMRGSVRSDSFLHEQ
jgi:hypothetical protein